MIAKVFIDESHSNTFQACLKEDGVHPGDRQRKAMFYILSGNGAVQEVGINRFYDFRQMEIKTDWVDTGLIPLEDANLVKLAYHLKDGTYPLATLVELFNTFTHDNFILAINAILIRFGLIVI